MEIPKEKILELIRQRGDEGQAAQTVWTSDKGLTP